MKLCRCLTSRILRDRVILSNILIVAKFLSVFAFVTWIRPNSVVINQLFGGTTGLSLIPITFDVRMPFPSAHCLKPIISYNFDSMLGMVLD